MVATYIKKIKYNVIYVALVYAQWRQLTCFWSVKCLGLLKILTLGLSQTP